VRGPALLDSRRARRARLARLARSERHAPGAKTLTPIAWRGHTDTMDLPRAELRVRGIAAIGAGAIRGWDHAVAWFKPRAAPLLITALATLCMLAGLDLIARDFRRLQAMPTQQTPVLYFSSQDRPGEVIPVELAPMPVRDGSGAP
jgi:hypothetical protein